MSAMQVPVLRVGDIIIYEKMMNYAFRIVKVIKKHPKTGLYEAHRIYSTGVRIDQETVVLKLQHESLAIPEADCVQTLHHHRLSPFVIPLLSELSSRVLLHGHSDRGDDVPDLQSSSFHVFVMQKGIPLGASSSLENDPRRRLLQFFRRCLSMLKGMTVLRELALTHGDYKVHNLLESVPGQVVMCDFETLHQFNHHPDTIPKDASGATVYTSSAESFAQMGYNRIKRLEGYLPAGTYARLMRAWFFRCGVQGYTFKHDEYSMAKSIHYLAYLSFTPSPTLDGFRQLGGFDFDDASELLDELTRSNIPEDSDDDKEEWSRGILTKLRGVMNAFEDFDEDLEACVVNMPHLPKHVKLIVKRVYDAARSSNFKFATMFPELEGYIHQLEDLLGDGRNVPVQQQQSQPHPQNLGPGQAASASAHSLSGSNGFSRSSSRGVAHPSSGGSSSSVAPPTPAHPDTESYLCLEAESKSLDFIRAEAEQKWTARLAISSSSKAPQGQESTRIGRRFLVSKIGLPFLLGWCTEGSLIVRVPSIRGKTRFPEELAAYCMSCNLHGPALTLNTVPRHFQSVELWFCLKLQQLRVIAHSSPGQTHLGLPAKSFTVTMDNIFFDPEAEVEDGELVKPFANDSKPISKVGLIKWSGGIGGGKKPATPSS